MSTFTSSTFVTAHNTSLTFIARVPTLTASFVTTVPRLCRVHSRDANALDDGRHRRVRMTTGQQQRVRRKENVAGEFYVDSSCIDCDTCRWLCPSVFNRQNDQSAVFQQPSSDAERLHALQALVACPTNSIRTVPTNVTTPSTKTAPSPNTKVAAKSFPLPYGAIPGVYYLGYASAHTFGASSWLLLGTDVTVMVDCPRYNGGLAGRIDALLEQHNRTGVDYILLTHCDDVTGHDDWAARLKGSKRIIHAVEQSVKQGTDKCEVVLNDDDFEQYREVRRFCIGKDVYILHVPGHTQGSLAVWDERSKSLFSGDHCWGGGGSRGIDHGKKEDKWVTASDRYCFFDFDTQVKNITALAGLGVRSVLPGHGKPVLFESEDEGGKAFAQAAERIRG